MKFFVKIAAVILTCSLLDSSASSFVSEAKNFFYKVYKVRMCQKMWEVIITYRVLISIVSNLSLCIFSLVLLYTRDIIS